MRHLAKTVERVDLMCIKEVINKLKKFHVDTEGSESLLKDKLKESYKKIYLAGMNLSLSKKLLPYYVIIDFEATCEENHSSDYM